MRYFLILLFVTSTAFAQGIPEGADPKFPIPVDAEVAYPRSVVDEVYGDQIKAARTIAEKARLATELFGLSSDAKNRFEEYVLIKQGQKLAISAKDLTLALRSVDLLAQTFRVDKKELRKEISAELAGGSESKAKTIKQLEQLDAIAKANPTKTLAVADACYKLAKTLRGPMQQTAIDRALKYYKAAMPKLTGLERKKAEGRVKRLKAMTARASKRLLRTDLRNLVGAWEVESKEGHKSVWTFFKDGKVHCAKWNKSGGVWHAEPDAVRIIWGGNENHWDELRRPLRKAETIGDSWAKGSNGFTVKKL